MNYPLIIIKYTVTLSVLLVQKKDLCRLITERLEINVKGIKREIMNFSSVIHES